MTKYFTKQRCVAAGVPTARFAVFAAPAAPWPAGWQPPVVLKPVRQGSSVGLQFVDRVADWPAALRESLQFDTEVLVEERIVGCETTVGILDGVALPVVEVRPHNGVYDFHSKYTKGATEYFCPADLPPGVTERVQAAALGAFAAIGGGDYARCGRDGPRERRAGGFGNQHTARHDRDKPAAQGGGRRGLGLSGLVSANGGPRVAPRRSAENGNAEVSAYGLAWQK